MTFGGVPGDLNAARLNEERVATAKTMVTMEWKIPQNWLTEKTTGYTAHTPPPALQRKSMEGQNSMTSMDYHINCKEMIIK